MLCVAFESQLMLNCSDSFQYSLQECSTLSKSSVPSARQADSWFSLHPYLYDRIPLKKNGCLLEQFQYI